MLRNHNHPAGISYLEVRSEPVEVDPFDDDEELPRMWDGYEVVTLFFEGVLIGASLMALMSLWM